MFRRALRGYHPDDVERLRERVRLAMEAGKPLEDIDTMALRTVRGGCSTRQVDGFRTVLSAWRRVTDVADPYQVKQAEQAAAAQQFQSHLERLRWSSEQIDAVRQRDLPLARRRKVAYDVEDVNAYLDGVIDAMRRGLEIPDPQYARFNAATRRRGYDPKPVDDLLAELAVMTPAGS